MRTSGLTVYGNVQDSNQASLIIYSCIHVVLGEGRLVLDKGLAQGRVRPERLAARSRRTDSHVYSIGAALGRQAYTQEMCYY